MSVFATKFGPGFLKTSQLGAVSGVASLDATGKLTSSQLPSGIAGGLNFKGAFDASGALPSSPTNGDLYMVSVAGTAGGTFTSPALAVGDYLFYSSTATAWEPIYAPKTSDQMVEGTTNLYFTNARAQAAAVENSLAASTVMAPSATAVNTALAGKAAIVTRFKERFLLTSTNITNQYIIASQLAVALSMTIGVQGLGLCEESTDGGSTGDFLLSTDGGTGHTKLTFKNDLATGGLAPLAAGDVIYLHYSY